MLLTFIQHLLGPCLITAALGLHALVQTIRKWVWPTHRNAYNIEITFQNSEPAVSISVQQN